MFPILAFTFVLVFSTNTYAKNVCLSIQTDDDALYPADNCSQFLQCVNGKPMVRNCPIGLEFNPRKKVCDWPEQAGCSKHEKITCLQSEEECPRIDGKTPVYLSQPNCSQFCECSNGVPYLFDCPKGLYFNPKLNVCDYPSNVACKGINDSSHHDWDDKKSKCIANSTACPKIDGKTPVYLSQPNCSQFCECSNGVPYLFDCPKGLHFNPKLNVCDYPSNVACKGMNDSSHHDWDDKKSKCIANSTACPKIDGKTPVYISQPNCSQFCECSNGVPYLFDCPKGLHFNPKLNVCDYPSNVACKRTNNDSHYDTSS